MGLFVKIEGAAAIARKKGLYKQIAVYSRDGALYVKVAGGYVLIYGPWSAGAWRTTYPDLMVVELIPPPGFCVKEVAQRNGITSLMFSNVGVSK